MIEDYDDLEDEEDQYEAYLFYASPKQVCVGLVDNPDWLTLHPDKKADIDIITITPYGATIEDYVGVTLRKEFCVREQPDQGFELAVCVEDDEYALLLPYQFACETFAQVTLNQDDYDTLYGIAQCDGNVHVRTHTKQLLDKFYEAYKEHEHQSFLPFTPTRENYYFEYLTPPVWMNFLYSPFHSHSAAMNVLQEYADENESSFETTKELIDMYSKKLKLAHLTAHAWSTGLVLAIDSPYLLALKALSVGCSVVNGIRTRGENISGGVSTLVDLVESRKKKKEEKELSNTDSDQTPK